VAGDNGDLPARIRAARALAGLSREQLAERLAVSVHTIAKWEAGTKLPNPARVEQIGSACGVPVEFFRVDLQALTNTPAVLSTQLAAIEDRPSRIEAELRIRPATRR
jgi:transcriptional regulator with XRE-family HTH domain